MTTSPPVILPPNLEHIALTKFDDLLESGEILHQPAKIDIVRTGVDGFQVLKPGSLQILSGIAFEREGLGSCILQFHFSTTPVLGSKPVLPPNDPGRSKPIGPFVDPPESFIVTRIGESHLVIVNVGVFNLPPVFPLVSLPSTWFSPKQSRPQCPICILCHKREKCRR